MGLTGLKSRCLQGCNPSGEERPGTRCPLGQSLRSLEGCPCSPGLPTQLHVAGACGDNGNGPAWTQLADLGTGGKLQRGGWAGDAIMNLNCCSASPASVSRVALTLSSNEDLLVPGCSPGA